MSESTRREPPRPWLTEGDGAGLSACLRLYEERRRAIHAALLGRIDGHGELRRVLRSTDAAPSFADELLRALRGAEQGRFAPLETLFEEMAVRGARSAVGLLSWYDAADDLRRAMTAALVQAHGSEPALLERAIVAMQRLADRALATVAGQYLRLKDRELAEQQRHTEQALLRFSRLSESGILGILVCDSSGTIRDANDGFLAMMGYSREELLSGLMRWSDLTPPEWKRQDDAAGEQLKACGMARPWEKEYLRKDGQRVPVLVGVATINAQERVAFVLDITERKSSEELKSRSLELEFQNQRIHEASRLKSDFLANMSHELRTPLNSIIGFAELLYDGEVSTEDPQHHEFLGDILNSGRHLLQLINDVLDLAKVESGKMDFYPETVDLLYLAQDVTSVLRSVTATKRLHLEIDVHPEVREVAVDPARLKQVLYNYISNAMKFTNEGGRVTLRALVDGPRSFRVEVEDTGIGVDPSDLGRLFVEFQQLAAASTKRHAGTGLGLALTKRLVEAQGGSVGVTSVLGRGSVFFAVLPRVAASSEPPPEAVGHHWARHRVAR